MVLDANIPLHYGTGQISLHVPDRNVQTTIRPWRLTEFNRADDPLVDALRGPQAEAFREAINSKNVCVLLPDCTRRTPFTQALPLIMDLLQACAQIRFIISTGTHLPGTAANQSWLQAILGAAQSAGLKHIQATGHHCRESSLRDIGKTRRGTPVIYNTCMDEAEVFWALSDVKVHYFAGYSNPIKNIVPGVCGYRTVEANHSWALHEEATYGRHPWHLQSERQHNPLALDQLEAARRIIGARPFYALVTVGSEGESNWAALGLASDVTPQAFTVADAHNTHTLPRTRRLVVSPGGHPDDVDLYIAQRALELTRAILEAGAEILFLAACPEGVGEAHTLENFYHRLTQPLSEILALSREQYVLFSHKPYKFAQLMRHCRRIWVASEIPPDQIRAMHLTPVTDPQDVVDGWLREDPDCRITLVDGANKIALYAREDVREEDPH